MAYLDFSNKRYSKDQLANLRAMLIKLNSSTLMPEEAGSITLDEFREWLEGTVDAYVDENQDSLKGPKGDTGSVGATGVGIQSISNFYAVTPTSASPTLSEITSPTIPVMSPYNKYLWQKEVTTFTDSTTSSNITLAGVYGDTGNTGAKGDKGDTGSQGPAGQNGLDGLSSYIHIKYADIDDIDYNLDPPRPHDADMHDAPSDWMGVLVDNNPIDSESASEYTWSQIKGEDGADGRGINIKASAEACTEVGDSYIRTSDGHLMILVTLPSQFEDAGQFKGDKGDTGATGAKGDKGDKGDTGDNGADATQYYYHIVYTNDTSTGEGYSTTPSNQLYLGTYTDTTLADAATWSDAQIKDIKWNYTKGATGAQGIQGEKGDTGAQGLSEITLMTTYTGTKATLDSWASTSSDSWAFSSITSDYSKVKIGDLVWFVCICNDATSPYYNKKGSVPRLVTNRGSDRFTTTTAGLSTEWEPLDGTKGDKGEKGDQGEKGDDGSDGVNGDYTEYQFARSDDPNNAPETGWQDGPPTTGGQYLWCRERRISY